MQLDEFTAKLAGPFGKDMYRCPAHPDDRASLSVTDGGDKILIYCHGRCNWRDVIEAMGVKPHELWYDGKGYYWNEGAVSKPMKQPDEVYYYKNEFGGVVYRVDRYNYESGAKSFRQAQLTENGWVWNMDGVKKVPYNLGTLFGAKVAAESPEKTMLTVYVVEGEKDADKLYKEGWVATCFVGGAGRGKFLARYVKYFVGLHVVIIADKDEPGLAYAREIEDALTGVAASVKVVQAAVGKDVSDHLDAGKTLDELEEVADEPQ